MDEMSVQGIGAVKSAAAAAGGAVAGAGQPGEFKALLENSLKELNDVNAAADKTIEQIAQGEVKDMHQVMLAVEKANLTFSTMMQIRNKLLDAYKEVMQMRF